MTSPPTERFSVVADLYARHRPSYPSGLLDWLAANTAGAAGARRRRRLRHRHLHALPRRRRLPRRRHRAQRGDARPGPRRHRRPGTSTDTGLPDAAVDLVTAAQAFHWFDLAPTIREFARIGRWACAFWNTRAPGRFNDDYERALLQFSDEYRSDTDEVEQRIRAFPASPTCARASFRYTTSSTGRSCTAAPGRPRTSPTASRPRRLRPRPARRVRCPPARRPPGHRLQLLGDCLAF